MMKQHACVAAVLWLAVAVAGCAPAGLSPEMSAQRAKFLLADEPTGAVSLGEARQALASAGPVVVVGVIGGVPDPWSKGRASFMIADPASLAVEEHEGDACHECAFCSKPKDEASLLALVEFVDEAGNVLPVDARALFDLEPRQMVVVRGTARVDALGHMVVAADGLYVRR